MFHNIIELSTPNLNYKFKIIYKIQKTLYY